nr:tyrosine-type recombinase/integrase [Sphaerisporangium rubeum]
MLELVGSWEMALRAAGRSEGTVRSYLDSVRALAGFLAERGVSADVEGVGVEDVRGFLEVCAVETSAGNAHKHFRNLRVFFNWLIAEGERVAGSPVEGVEAPEVGVRGVEVLGEGELAALVEVCSGGSWVDRRDMAIIRILMDNGMRVSGLAGLRYRPDDESQNDVRLEEGVLRIDRGVGREAHLAPVGAQAVGAIDRYLRARARHPHASSPWLWLPMRGVTARGGERRLTASGIQQILERRGREAGIAGRLHPHRFRYTVAEGHLAAGGDPLELMRITGWRSTEMVRRFVQTRGGEREGEQGPA